MLSMKTLNNIQYPPAGVCIYCGSTQNLTKEHILPFGLSGTAVLPVSSCRTCASITGAVEQKILRGSMWPVRVFRDLKSRTKHRDAPDQYSLTVVKNGKEFQIEVHLEDVPVLLPFPIFVPPAFLNPKGYKGGIQVSGVNTISFGSTSEYLAEKLGVENIKLTHTVDPVAFARMIAKIAYAWAAAENQLCLLNGSPLVVSAILGHTDDIGRWVGTITEPTVKYDGLLHRLLAHQVRDMNLLIVEVHLFSDSETPRYGVIIGELA